MTVNKEIAYHLLFLVARNLPSAPDPSSPPDIPIPWQSSHHPYIQQLTFRNIKHATT